MLWKKNMYMPKQPRISTWFSALTHITQICHNFDVANSSWYCTGFAPMLFQWSYSCMACFSLQICCDFFTAWFFHSRPFLSHDFCFVEWFFRYWCIWIGCISKTGQILWIVVAFWSVLYAYTIAHAKVFTSSLNIIKMWMSKEEMEAEYNYGVKEKVVQEEEESWGKLCSKLVSKILQS